LMLNPGKRISISGMVPPRISACANVDMGEQSSLMV
jgi:hypothetical protein